MTERDDNIEFDFFDEPETAEATRRARLVRSPRGPRGPRRPIRAPTGLTPLLRLAGLVAFAILIVVLLVFWAQSCRGASKRSSYRNYFEKVQTIAAGSQRNGAQLNTALTTPGLKQAGVVSKLRLLSQNEQLNVDNAEKLAPPGPLRVENQHLIEALQLRVSGLRGLADAFRSTARSSNAAAAGSLLSTQAQRLAASDVVWDDLFKDPAVTELRRQDVSGVAVPDSNFLTDAEVASSRSMQLVFQRMRGAARGGTTAGPRGTGLVSVTVLPAGDELSTSTLNTITASTNLAFRVAVKDTGSSQEVRIPVAVTIKANPPIVRRATIASIDPGETKTVTISDIGEPPFSRTTITVAVKPVKQEKTKTNNSAVYPAIFSVP